jgi:hypothetical protein
MQLGRRPPNHEKHLVKATSCLFIFFCTYEEAAASSYIWFGFFFG